MGKLLVQLPENEYYRCCEKMYNHVMELSEECVFQLSEEIHQFYPREIGVL